MIKSLSGYLFLGYHKLLLFSGLILFLLFGLDQLFLAELNCFDNLFQFIDPVLVNCAIMSIIIHESNNLPWSHKPLKNSLEIFLQIIPVTYGHNLRINPKQCIQNTIKIRVFQVSRYFPETFFNYCWAKTPIVWHLWVQVNMVVGKLTSLDQVRCDYWLFLTI